MKKIMLLLLLAVIIGLSEHIAITDNGIKVILKDDGTWAVVDSIEGEFEQVMIATTESNRRVILLPERWRYILEELHTQQAEKKDLFPQLEVKRGRKSVATGYAWSIGTTIFPLSCIISAFNFPGLGILAISGIIVGPSAGHFYAGQWGRGLATSAIRVGAGAVILQLALDIGEKMPFEDYSPDIAIMIPFGCIAVGTVIYDIFTVPNSVSKYNREHNWMLQPELDFKDKRYGINIVYRF